MNPRMISRRPRWATILVVVALAAVAIVAVRSLREPVLRAAGWALVVNEPAAPADIIVVSLQFGGAGALEPADLVQSGIAKRVAVFADPRLGVTDVVQIPRTDVGTEGEGQVLPPWCDEHQLRSIVFVAAMGGRSFRVWSVTMARLLSANAPAAGNTVTVPGYGPTPSRLIR